MALILQIETSTTVCSVALAENGQCIALKELDERNIHATSITNFIDDVMQQANKSYTDLSAVAVAKGPGSYTGLRIGVSTAKGLCFALDIPLISVNTLEMMVEGYLENNGVFSGYVVPMLDARRMEVFTGIWDCKMNLVENTAAVILDENYLHDLISEHKVAFIGDGAPKFSILVKNEHAVFPDENYNSAKYLSKSAFSRFQSSKFDDVAYFEPYYLKDFMVIQPKKKL